MNTLEVIREKWLTEHARYEAVAKAACRILEETLREKHVNVVSVRRRVKELPSLLKKVIRNPGTDDPYSGMTDKAGVRAVVLFRRDIEMADEAIQHAFVVVKRDDKQELLGPDRLGYASVHFDARLANTDVDTDTANLVFEIQLRTLCQHAWAEMSHTMAYKSDWEPPVALSRELNCLSALLEVADAHFQLVWDRLNSLPEGVPYKILTVLEKYFLSMAPRRYDRALSLHVIAHLMPMLDTMGSPDSAVAALDGFCLSERGSLSHVLSTYADRNVFLGQPEAILIFFLLGRNKFALRDLWQRRFPVEDIEELAGLWCVPYPE